MRPVRFAAALMAGALLMGPPTRAEIGTRSAADPAFAMARRMGRGINILGYDGIWDGASNAPFRLDDLARIKAAGFDNVRINLFGFRYLDEAGHLRPVMLEALDRVLDRATAAGLVPVIDEHDYAACQADPASCAPKLRAFWREIAGRYAGRYPTAVFELLNEPGGSMTTDAWNSLANELLTTIRAAEPKRTVIVAAINSDDPNETSRLTLPPGDRNIIVTVHYYKPITFTHQGAPWSPEFKALHDVGWGSASDEKLLADDFDTVARWAEAAGRPLYLGEFGVYEAAPMAARTRWLAAVRRTAERHGWPWAYWQFDHDFAAFDEGTNHWVEPVVRALTDKSPP